MFFHPPLRVAINLLRWGWCALESRVLRRVFEGGMCPGEDSLLVWVLGGRELVWCCFGVVRLF